MDISTIAFELIAEAGEAKSFALSAINMAKEGKAEESHAILSNCDESLCRAHAIQKKLIVSDMEGDAINISLIMVHAQDHLASAILVRELSEILINQYYRIQKLEKGGGCDLE